MHKKFNSIFFFFFFLQFTRKAVPATISLGEIVLDGEVLRDTTVGHRRKTRGLSVLESDP